MPEPVSLTDSIAAYQHSLNQYIFQWLRNQIVTLQPGFHPGDRLNSQAIAETLGISKTPVTYAINQLAALHLIVVRPRSGTFVADPTIEEIRDTFALVAQLEVSSLRLLQQDETPPSQEQLGRLARMGQEVESGYLGGELETYLDAERSFHNAIAGLAGNRRLVDAHLSACHQVYLANSYIALADVHIETALEQHGAIVSSLERGLLRPTMQLLEDHWRDQWRWYLEARSNGDALRATT